MNVFKIIALSEGVLAFLIAGTWRWLLRQPDASVGWRRTASRLALAFTTLALTCELLFASATAHYGTQVAWNTAAWGQGQPEFAVRFLLCSFFASGPLSLCGLVLATVGKGKARVPAALWSMLVLGSFFGNLALMVNSIH